MKFISYLRNTRAVSALEYAILVGIVATAIAAGLATFSETISTAIQKIGTNITGNTQVDDAGKKKVTP